MARDIDYKLYMERRNIRLNNEAIKRQRKEAKLFARRVRLFIRYEPKFIKAFNKGLNEFYIGHMFNGFQDGDIKPFVDFFSKKYPKIKFDYYVSPFEETIRIEWECDMT